MLIHLAIGAVGIVILVSGGELLVKGAAALARGMGISSLVVGLTVVAFGTSAPELAVNVTAALGGKGDISFGNIVGSSIANIGLIVGATALVRPLKVHRKIILREIPMMLLAAAATLVLCLDDLLDGAGNAFTRADGCILLLFFAVFLYYTVGEALRQRGGRKQEPEAARPTPVRDLLLILLGLGALAAGGHLTVDGAVGLARGFGISEVLIGLTVVAIGSSLPELVTAIIASARGHADLALGNVTGSNIFNLLFVLGVTATLRPIAIPPGGRWDLLVMAVLTVTVLPLSINPDRSMGRGAGIVLLGTYAAYIVARALV